MRLLSKCNEDLQMCQQLIFCKFPGFSSGARGPEIRRIPLYCKSLRRYRHVQIREHA
jgi:hypothetical protein